MKKVLIGLVLWNLVLSLYVAVGIGEIGRLYRIENSQVKINNALLDAVHQHTVVLKQVVDYLQ